MSGAISPKRYLKVGSKVISWLQWHVLANAFFWITVRANSLWHSIQLQREFSTAFSLGGRISKTGRTRPLTIPHSLFFSLSLWTLPSNSLPQQLFKAGLVFFFRLVSFYISFFGLGLDRSSPDRLAKCMLSPASQHSLVSLQISCCFFNLTTSFSLGLYNDCLPRMLTTENASEFDFSQARQG